MRDERRPCLVGGEGERCKLTTYFYLSLSLSVLNSDKCNLLRSSCHNLKTVCHDEADVFSSFFDASKTGLLR